MVGTHIRLNETLNHVIEKATNLNVPIFQMFLINSQGKRIKVTPEEKQFFIEMQQKFDSIFVHASY